MRNVHYSLALMIRWQVGVAEFSELSGLRTRVLMHDHAVVQSNVHAPTYVHMPRTDIWYFNWNS